MGRNQEFDTNAVLDKAMELFWHQGYEKTSIQQLTEYMGIERGSIYNTFGGKHKLFLTVLAHYQELNHPDHLNQLDNVPSIKQLLGQLLLSVIDDSTSKKGCLVVNTLVEMAAHNEQLRSIVTDDLKYVQKLFFQALQKGKQTGEFSSEMNAEAMAAFFVNHYVGLQALSKSNMDKESLVSTIDTLLSYL
ncbi:TetR/AcrR family transcriptional regulator [Paenibacillus durus]|uniref:HTH tetR-type domain-containing protein n=1 Tax=Paenibacillus durus ATCC 35681 TaxID=1333534 RepID=A0A0F7F8M2_PAEDU|nr:TetR/AcrR family transcriptional regulator [Paenibacillus durus]AKG34127.1 hypothetical protein VK70_05665 [Paenibacillus durus ATCC 35681]